MAAAKGFTRRMNDTGETGGHGCVGKTDEPRARVLIIDDEELLARALGRALSPQCDYVICSRARSALELLARGLRFDLILCDLAMPEMTGMDLHEELVKIAPEVAARMVFMTGGATAMRAQTFLERVPNERLEKPFQTQHVLALIEQRARRRAAAG